MQVPTGGYSPRALYGMTWRDSKADSTVWMEEDLRSDIDYHVLGFL